MIHLNHFGTLQEAVLFCSGALSLGPVKSLYNLVGQTLTFTFPIAGGVTFVAAAGTANGLTFAQVADQLQTAQPTLKLFELNKTAYLQEVTPRYGVGFSTTDQVARRELGVGSVGAVVRSRVLGPIGSATAPSLISFVTTNRGIEVVWEDTDQYGSRASSTRGFSLANAAATAEPTNVVSPPSRAIYCGSAGNLVVHRLNDPDAQYATYVIPAAGTYIYVVADQIRKTTTVTAMEIEQ
jgi:hypothetical protein